MLSKSLRSLARVGNAQKVSRESQFLTCISDFSDSPQLDTSLIIEVSRLKMMSQAGKYLFAIKHSFSFDQCESQGAIYVILKGAHYEQFR